MGYFSGSAPGLLTGVACGYSAKIRYWINPIIKVLGPIPTATCISLMVAEMMGVEAGLDVREHQMWMPTGCAN